jgi:GNAT superfamily N-acetyltransferase
MYANRPACKADFVTIATFPLNERELFFVYPRATYPVTADVLEETASRRVEPTVITAGTEIVGYSNLYDVEEGRHCWLGNVVVSPAHRGKGVGSYLIETMMAKAKKNIGVNQLKLMCHNINTNALVFYNRLGFKPFDLQEVIAHNGNKLVLIKLQIDL